MRDVESVLNELGIEIVGTSRSRKTGQVNYQARCPHHYKGKEVDHSPSWYINAETGMHFCQSCRWGGTLEWLLHTLTGRPLSEFDQLRGKRALERLKSKDPWGGERPIERPVFTSAQVKMHGRPPQWAMDKRQLTPEMVETYDIRWAPLFIHNKRSYENCWITPICDPETNRVMGMQVKQESGERFFRNLPGDVAKSVTLFGIHLLVPDQQARVVESPLDAPLASSPGVVGVSSMSAHISISQMSLMIERSCGIIFALDNDKAGRESTNHLLGLDPKGRPRRFLYDYSRRIPIRVSDYTGIDAKDLGDMTSEQREVFLNRSWSSTLYKVGVA